MSLIKFKFDEISFILSGLIKMNNIGTVKWIKIQGRENLYVNVNTSGFILFRAFNRICIAVANDYNWTHIFIASDHLHAVNIDIRLILKRIILNILGLNGNEYGCWIFHGNIQYISHYIGWNTVVMMRKFIHDILWTSWNQRVASPTTKMFRSTSDIQQHL